MSGVGLDSLGEKVYYLKKTKEKFKDTEFPRAELRNIIFGNRYVFFKGNLKIVNMDSGEHFVINFPGHSWTGQKVFDTTGYVADANGEKKLILKGNWIKNM